MAKTNLKLGKKQTLRQRTQTGTMGKPTRQISRSRGAASNLVNFLSREYYLPLPDTRIGRFLNKKRHIFPLYFRESARELKQVSWPSRKETWKLTLAVFIFAIIFGLLAAVVDFGLDKLFRKVILKT